AHGVVGGVLAVAPAVQHNEHDRTPLLHSLSFGSQPTTAVAAIPIWVVADIYGEMGHCTSGLFARVAMLGADPTIKRPPHLNRRLPTVWQPDARAQTLQDRLLRLP